MERKRELVNQIIQQVYQDALGGARDLTLYNDRGEPIMGFKNLPEWKGFQEFLSSLPDTLDVTSEESLRVQLEKVIPGDKSFQKMDRVDEYLFSLWRYFDELGLNFDLSDDGLDEAGMQKDMLIYLIKDILDPSKEILVPGYLARNWVREEFMDEGFPPMWVKPELKEALAEELAKDRIYCTATKLWMIEEMGYKGNPRDCSKVIKRDKDE